MSPQYTELWKLNSRHLHTRSVLYILAVQGKKYLNTFIVTNANDCPNILSHGATFRMGVLVPNYTEENVVKQGDKETGTSNVFQILQDLWIKQYQGNSEPKAYQPSTTFTTSTTKQPKVSKTHGTASQKAGTTIYTDNMSQTPTPCRTMPPPKTKTSHSTRQSIQEIHQNSSHSGPPTCCMHVHQLQSQICKLGKPPALKEVKHPYKGRTSVSRFPLAKQGISSQDSSYFEGIGHFTRDSCKFHLKSDPQPMRHASEEVNAEKVNTHWVHSYRMEHAEHFPAPMEMCMDDHLTQTTERTQWQHHQDIRHAEFPPDMENIPVFLGNQSQQGNEKIMDTGTFALGNTILNRYPTLSTHTHHEMESSNLEAFPSFNFYADATPQMETSRKGPGADSTPSGKDTTVTSSWVTPMDPMDDIQPPTRKCISPTSVHFQDSLSNKSDQLLKSKAQGNWLTGLSHQFNTDFLCDEKRNDRDLHRSWNDREQLSNTTLNTTSMTTIQHLMSEHCCGSISNRSTRQRRIQHRRSTSQDPQATITQTSCVTEKADRQIFKSLGPTRNFYTTDPYSLIRDTRSYQQHTKKSTFFQDHWRQWHTDTDTQRKKPPSFRTIRTPTAWWLRSSEVQKFNTGPATETRIQPIHRNRKSLSFKPHLLIMMIETLSGTILLRNFHLTLSTRQNQILPLFLILYFRKKGGNRRRCSCTCRRCTCTCTYTTCTCTHTGDSQRMTTHSRNKEVHTQELWEASQCI